jgi:hypothetical protein
VILAVMELNMPEAPAAEEKTIWYSAQPCLKDALETDDTAPG